MALILEYLPRDSSAQSHAFEEAVRRLAGRIASKAQPLKLLDLGCGRADSYERFKQAGMQLSWLGLEIGDSPEARGGVVGEATFQVYDGRKIPYPAETFDAVYSRQVFEHVWYPRELIGEVSRVLKKAGIFVGSCSALEPFHSRSVCNFTPYGFATLLRDAGLSEICIRPGVDGLFLIARRLAGLAGIAPGSWLFVGESPLNLFLETVSRIMGFEARRRAALKLLFCGHFVFSAVKGA
ncbi:MAG: hypothetical protein A2V99_03555 [Spirochaetes bacterium RBG_16_67_19]|nr:MAG: hypothetical protein A2V99_03555 [Spirochaetes bacterium RBG_16_67_19]